MKKYFTMFIEWVKRLWKKVSDLITAWVNAVPHDKKVLFVVGIIVAAFFNITLAMKFCVLPAFVVGFVKEFRCKWIGGKFDGWNLLAITIGGLVPELFVLLRIWWY